LVLFGCNVTICARGVRNHVHYFAYENYTTTGHCGHCYQSRLGYGWLSGGWLCKNKCTLPCFWRDPALVKPNLICRANKK
jgi:hypothetical protein